MYDLTIYRDVNVIIQDKQGRKFYADLPMATYNPITQKFMAVENNRGLGYAHRNAMRYRKKN